MMYKVGPYYVTTVVMPIPIFVWKKTEERYPSIITALSVSLCKQEGDYYYLSRQLKEKRNIESLRYGTDGEPALENGFEETYPIESELCFLSLSRYFYKKWLVHTWTKFNPGKKESLFWFCLVIFHCLNGTTNFSILNKTSDLIIFAWKTYIYLFVKKTVFQLVLTIGHLQK